MGVFMELYGLIGEKLGHSLSPQLHRCIYRETGRRGAYYTPYEVERERLDQVVPAMRTLGIGGFNVTMPYKQDIMQYLDGVERDARAIGSVNTLLRRCDGGVWGHNTDAYGFVASLGYHGVEIEGKRFVMCGMSGAGRAIRHGLTQAGAAEVVVVSTDPQKGISYRELEQLPPKDVIVNCTPLGMFPHVDRCAVDDKVLQKFAVAVDIVYNPLETLFLRKARGLGLATVDGLYMLIFQGMRSFEIWTDTGLSGELAGDIYKELAPLIQP